MPATYFIAAHPGGSASYTTSVPGTHSTRLSVSITEEIAPSSYGSTSEMSRALASDSDGDGVFDIYEDTNVDLDGDPSTNPGPDTDGDLTPNYLDPDDDGDGLLTIHENADPNTDGNPADAQDTDGDAIPNYLDADDNDGPTGDLDGDGVHNQHEQPGDTDGENRLQSPPGAFA